MNDQLIEKTKKLLENGVEMITNPYYLGEENRTEQQTKSMRGQRGLFLDFHEQMFSLKDSEIMYLRESYKRFYTENKLSESEYIYNDLALINDAIDYQYCIRFDDLFDLQITSDVVESWREGVKIAEERGVIDSDHLISIIKFLYLNKHSVNPKQKVRELVQVL